MAGRENQKANDNNAMDVDPPPNASDSQEEGFKIGDTLIAKWMDGESRSCVIIEKSTWWYIIRMALGSQW